MERSEIHVGWTYCFICVLEEGEPWPLDVDAIFECGMQCRCDPSKCPNRRIQHAKPCADVEVHLCCQHTRFPRFAPQRAFPKFFKTRNKGWGVRATCDIAACVYIAEYLGEMVLESESQFRQSAMYDGLAWMYQFSMDHQLDPTDPMLAY